MSHPRFVCKRLLPVFFLVTDGAVDPFAQAFLSTSRSRERISKRLWSRSIQIRNRGSPQTNGASTLHDHPTLRRVMAPPVPSSGLFETQARVSCSTLRNRAAR